MLPQSCWARHASSQANNELTIGDVEKNSPAAASGLESKDVIVSIDGQPTKGLLVDDCAAIMRGITPACAWLATWL